MTYRDIIFFLLDFSATMDKFEDLYEVFQVSPTASTKDITRQWRKKWALELHPDKIGGSADLFHKYKTIYNTLSDPEKRKTYDEVLRGKAAKLKREAEQGAE